MNQRLSRRTLLRGAGACLALPVLEAMLPRSARAQQSLQANRVPRMVCCYVPNGVNEEQWLPQDAGPNWTLSPTLEVLKDFRRQFTLISGLGHANSEGGHSGADTWLTGANLEGTSGKDYQNSISVDQLAAEIHRMQTRLPSLELGDSGGTGVIGHSHTLAFDQAGTALPTENNPQRIFDRLFSPDDPSSRDASLKRYALRRSILDDVGAEARSLSQRLGRSDQRKIDEYLSSVRETERRVQGLQSWIDVPKPQVSRDGLRLNARPDPHGRSAWLEVMLDLCLLAIQTDTTRVITFQWAREAHGYGPNGEDHHALSHHGGDPGVLAQLAAVDRFYLGALKRFLERLSTAREHDGCLLDTTMVLYGSGMNSGKGGGHSPKNVPLLLAGGLNLGLKHGAHLRFAVDSTPLSNVLLTMLHAMGGASQGAFMDSTGELAGLT